MSRTETNTIQYMSRCLSLCCLLICVLAACSHRFLQEPVRVDYGSAPTLSGLQATPNPAQRGGVIQLCTTYVDPDSDLHTGLAAISVDGGEPQSLAFRATYPSGVLTLPFSISPYARPSDLRILLKIRDDAGNWSNAVSVTVQIREATQGNAGPHVSLKKMAGL
ncbi:hypothetical protein CSB45_06830 [candidate division KSB3 bacterium]|uniref:Cadherin domain-containing protein n=1 Tax=candidate division KSB3 bacterium TaxID=2044937 RepID=A0A2G6E620_9BACT|nr:MAG: hypothetical protein CSB45_06830 [candidate division KSB3 bacterium]PIE30051.1 MAG: hypothetical protein CSA57_05765 [candidate division KSB3 bacterium]